LDAAQAVQRQQEQQAEAAAGKRKQPELIGFILLDPMWEGGEEVGYVSSIVRMKRSAHSGGVGPRSRKLAYADAAALWEWVGACSGDDEPYSAPKPL
jgi:hypothetical protein